MVPVDFVGDALLKSNRRELICRGQRDLDRPGAVHPEKSQLVRRHAAALAEFSRDHPGHAADRHPGAALPGPGHGVAGVEPLDGIDEVAHEVAPAQLAVGEDLKSQLFLSGEHALDVPVLDRLQPLRIGPLLPRFQQFSRPQKTADVISSIRGAHGEYLNKGDVSEIILSTGRQFMLDYSREDQTWRMAAWTRSHIETRWGALPQG